ncbi:MAG: PBSX family phage terminase large subunit [Cryomorphaceae bacterium]|nr:MAG: PBSX family phage terminase large subunit [Cryomorphaceae bacterium]
MNIDLLITTNFEKHSKPGAKIVISQGGGRSGKTFSILQLLILTAIQNKNILISVVAENVPFLKRGAMRDFRFIMQECGLWTDTCWKKAESTYVFQNGAMIEFFAADNPGKALGSARDILFINECNNVKYEIAFQLLARTKQRVFLDYNPVSEFWVHTEIMANNEFSEQWEYIHSTYKDNEQLDEEIIKTMLARASKDANYRRVYIEGEVGSIEGLIFPTFHQIDTFPDHPHRYGLDFGYSNDPTALVKVATRGDDIYIDEILYRTGMVNSELSNLMQSMGVRKSYDEIIADSAEPKTIAELHRMGWNVKPAVKGADSIRAGIDKIKQYNIHVTKRSQNLIKELRNYSWVTDKDGKITNKPIDEYNHAIDAVRYERSIIIRKNHSVTHPARVRDDI